MTEGATENPNPPHVLSLIEDKDLNLYLQLKAGEDLAMCLY